MAKQPRENWCGVGSNGSAGMKVAIGGIVGLVIGFLAMDYFKSGHLSF
jgi:hypothetical protein